MNSDYVKKQYNLTAYAYNQDRSHLHTGKYVRQFLHMLPKYASVLDVGCGNGVPVASEIIQRGHLVTGIDISPVQIELARQNCPRGEFLVRDLLSLREGEYSVDGLVCLYTLFHTPREQHQKLLQIFASFLPKNGVLLLSMGERDFEGLHDFYDTQMWSSHFGPSKNTQMVKTAGFEVLLDTVDSSGNEKHQIILARKK